MLGKCSLTLVLVAVMLNAAAFGMHLGFEEGYDYANGSLLGLSFIGFTRYGYVAGLYGFAALLLLAVWAGKLIKKELVSQLVCLPSLVWILFIYRQVLQQKYDFNQELASFHRFLTATISLDWLSVLIISVLLVIQIISAAKILYGRYKARFK
ncbi:MAG TPA: hypothetical protein VK400_00570 [Pyrinomonadaceae bacterium]|nr:hypothetical protein [Pyrinomonadaceae bacterium]